VSLSLADGMPVVWASRLLGARVPEKVSGSDLVLPLMKLAAARAWRVYFVGGAEGVAATAAQALRRQIPDLEVVGAEGPRIDPAEPASSREELLARVQRARPDLVLVALGNPKQELWIDEVRDALRPSVLVAVGAGLDFVAGVVRRAPRWISAVGLEWLYRLTREPRRLWRRYLLRDPRFILIVWRMLRERRDGTLRTHWPGLLGKALTSLRRDRELSLTDRLMKGFCYVSDSLTAPFLLRACDRVGVRARTRGRPIIENQGWIELGEDALLNSSVVPVRLTAASRFRPSRASASATGRSSALT
jgi:N-acetylglucosaminyldiphosphoundecaprenol N-acetyl-beta-D-mannosaminyltransferase